MTPEQKKWLDQYLSESAQFKQGGASQLDIGDELQYNQLSPGALESLTPSEMGGIETDPRYKDAQLAALSSLEERSKSGLTAQDEADMFRLNQQVNQANRGRLGAIQNQMATRGMSGSGMDAMMQLQSNQDAAERQALAAMEKAGQTQDARFRATAGLGDLGSQLQAREFGQKAQQASAQDAINRFNVANRVGQQQNNQQIANQQASQNWNRRNQVGDANANNRYDFRRDSMSAGQGAAQMGYNAATESENRRLLAEQERRRRQAAQTGAILGVVGGVGGAVVGGPAGAAAGAQIGQGVGQAYGGGYATGGIVGDEESIGFGDSPENDVMSIDASPGEVVAPRSVVAASMADPNNTAWNDYMNRLKASVAEKQAAKDSAESMTKVAQGGAVITDLLNNYNKGNRKDAVLHNSMQSLGSAPSISRGEPMQINDMASGIASENLSRADRDLERGKAEFGRGEMVKRQLGAEQSAAERNSPNSPMNQAKARYLESLSPGSSFQGMSGDDLDAIGQYVKMGLSANIARQKMQADKDMKEKELEAAKSKEAKADEKQKFDTTKDLRREISNDEVIKKGRLVDMAVSQVRALATGPQTASSDEALIKAFQKILDPTSVVREAEFAQTAEAGGLLTKSAAYAQQLQTGEILQPAQRAQILATIDSIQRGNQGFIKNHMSMYDKAIQEQGLPRDQIFSSVIDNKEPMQPPPVGSGSVNSAKDLP